jgi:hypothetical protein
MRNLNLKDPDLLRNASAFSKPRYNPVPFRTAMKEYMTTTEYLCRHFSRMGARLKVQGPRARQGEKHEIDVGRDLIRVYWRRDHSKNRNLRKPKEQLWECQE